MFSQVLQLASDYGWVGILFFLTVGIFWKGLTYFLGNKFKLSSPFSSKVVPENDLKFHRFFNNAEYRLVVEIPSLELMPNKPTKQQMFRDIIFLETRIIYDVCETIAKISMDAWSDEQWIAEISKKVNEIVTTFYKKAVESGVPELVIIKYNKWHHANYEALYDYINDLGTSTIYQSHLAKTNTFFLIMNLMLLTTIADAERSIKELNGDVAGKLYKNMVIEG